MANPNNNPQEHQQNARNPAANQSGINEQTQKNAQRPGSPQQREESDDVGQTEGQFGRTQTTNTNVNQAKDQTRRPESNN